MNAANHVAGGFWPRHGPALLLLLLAIPFEPFWPDFEQARRGLLAVAAGVTMLTVRTWLPMALRGAGGLLLALALWLVVAAFFVTHTGRALDRVSSMLALWAVLGAATRSEPVAWLRACLPAGLLVSAYGLVQALGIPQALHQTAWDLDPVPTGWSMPWLWLQNYLAFGSAAEPVSTLGNRNVASELVAVTGCGAAALVARATRWRLAGLTLGLAAAYLVVNQSRSGLLALPAGCSIALLGSGVRRRLAVVVLLGAGAAAGLLVQAARPGAPANPAAPTIAPRLDPPSTIEVRVEIWKACQALITEHPWIGHGPGQFATEYPRHRTAREIDLSTTGEQGARSFHAEPGTAHNDYLELTVEGGILGLGLWLGVLALGILAAKRSPSGIAAPLVAFALLGAVRSPLANAPVAALALGCIGAVSRPMPVARWRWLAWPLLALSLGAAAAGLLALAAQTVWAGYLRNQRFPRADFARLAVLERAIRLAPLHTDLRALRVRQIVATQGAKLQPEDVDTDLDQLAKLDPYNTSALLLRAEVAHQLGQRGRAQTILAQLAKLDPLDPESTILTAVIAMEQSNAALAVAVLERDPHPRLRRELAKTFADLATAATARGQSPSEVLTYRIESAFVDAIDALHAGADSAMAARKIQDLAAWLREAGVADPRPLVLGAIYATGRGDADQARQLGLATQRLDVKLTAPNRRLLGSLVDPLRRWPEWQVVLDAGD